MQTIIITETKPIKITIKRRIDSWEEKNVYGHKKSHQKMAGREMQTTREEHAVTQE